MISVLGVNHMEATDDSIVELWSKENAPPAGNRFDNIQSCGTTVHTRLDEPSDEFNQAGGHSREGSENERAKKSSTAKFLLQRVGLRIIVLGLIILAFYYLPISEWLEGYIDWTGKVDPKYRALYFIMGATTFHAFSPTGYLPTVLAGITFDQIYQAWPVAWASVTAGAAFNLILVRTCLRPLASLVTNRKREGFKFMRAMIEAKPATTVLLFRCPYLWVGLANYLFALSEIDVKTYMWCNAVGFLPGSFLFAFLGMNARNLFEMVTSGNWSAEEAAVFISVTVITVVCIAAGIIVGKRVLANSRTIDENTATEEEAMPKK